MRQGLICLSVFVLSGILYACSSLSHPEEKLPNPPAPFEKKNSQNPSVQVSPVFDGAKRVIRFGTKSLQVFNSGVMVYMGEGHEISKIYFYAKTPYSPWISNQNANITVPSQFGKRLGVTSFTVDEASKSFIIAGRVPCHAKGETERCGNYKMTISLLSSDKVDIRLEHDLPVLTGKSAMNLMWQTSNAETYSVNGKKSVFPKNRSQQMYGNPEKILVFTEPSSSSFEIDVESKLAMFARQDGLLAFHPRANKASPGKHTINLKFAPLEYGGSAETNTEDDLMASVDALDVAPSPTRNLAHNPYFAQGRLFLTNWNLIVPWLSTELVTVSEDDPKFGKHCLKMTMPPKGLSNFIFSPIPVENSGAYTISFYARASKLPVQASVAVTNHAYKSYGKKRYSLTTEWKRYSLTFKAPSRTCLTPRFVFKAPEGGVAYLDGIQIEKGDKATAFVAPPVSAMLLTSSPGDFIESGKPIDARLTLSTLEDSVSGEAMVTASNIFGETFYRKTINFNFKKDETPEFKLDLDGKTPDGVHTVKVAFKVGALKYNDFFRFSVMPFLANKHKMKNMFSNNYAGGCYYADAYPGLENYYRRNMQIGCGCNVHQPYPTKALDELCAKYRFELLDSSVGSRTGKTEKFKKFFPKTDPKPGHTYLFFYFTDSRYDYWAGKGGLLPDYRLCGCWTPEYRDKVKKIVAEIVKKASPRRIYLLGSEFPKEIKDDPHYPDLIMAVREGVKSVYPDSLFAEGGACNMDIGRGVREIDEFLEKVKGKMPIEVVQTHTYTHNILNLEPNFKALVDVVEKKHGYKNVKYYFAEGMHYGPYEVPAWGLESAKWDNQGWSSGTLSYDIGWVEKRSAAYFMRSWLIFMTKPDQVISANSSATNRPGVYNLDLDLRPRVYQKIPNTLSVLLGNVKRFVKDVSFANGTKCLVWEDGKGRGVAAVWNQEPLVDKGMKQGPMARADFGKQKVEFFDMMGAERTVRKDNCFPVSPFPLFIRGEKGKIDELCHALAHAEIIGKSAIPLRISEDLTSPTCAKITLTNSVSRDVSGTLEVAGNTKKLNLKPFVSVEVPVNLKLSLSFDRIETVNIPYTFTGEKGQKASSEIKFKGFAVKPFKGNWKDIPAIPITNKCISATNQFLKHGYKGDLTANFQAAWDKDYLYLKVNVVDDVFKHEEYPNAGQRWNNDSLQIFFDTRCSARKNGTTTFDEDDYAYTLMPSADGKSARMFRCRTPDMQLTLGTSAPKDKTFANDIACKFTKTDKGYVYETAIPARYLLPARLEANYSMGFALFINDRDKDKNAKWALTMTPKGTGPYNRPNLYPIMILASEND